MKFHINKTENIDLGSRRLALFGDSFAKACIKYLSFYFDQIMYVRSPFIIEELASKFQPSHIITSNAERYLSSVPLWREKEQEVLSTVKSAVKNLEDKTAKFSLEQLVGVIP